MGRINMFEELDRDIDLSNRFLELAVLAKDSDRPDVINKITGIISNDTSNTVFSIEEYDKDSVVILKDITVEGLIDKIYGGIKKIIKWIIDKFNEIYKAIKIKIRQFVQWLKQNKTLIDKLDAIPDVSEDNDDRTVREDLTEDDIKEMQDIAFQSLVPWMQLITAFTATAETSVPDELFKNMDSEEDACRFIYDEGFTFIGLAYDILHITEKIVNMDLSIENLSKVVPKEEEDKNICNLKNLSTGALKDLINNRISTGRDKNTYHLVYGAVIDKAGFRSTPYPIIWDEETESIDAGMRRSHLIVIKEDAYKELVDRYKKAINIVPIEGTYDYLLHLGRIQMKYAKDLTVISKNINTINHKLLDQYDVLIKKLDAAEKEVSKRKGELTQEQVSAVMRSINTISDKCLRKMLKMNIAASRGYGYSAVFNGSLLSINDGLDKIGDKLFVKP